jgi:hypothetical protein
MRQAGSFLKNFLSVILLSIFLLCFSDSVSAQNENDFTAGEIVVKLKNADDLRDVAARYNLSPQPLDRFGSRPIFRLQILDETPPPDLAERLLKDSDGRVIYAEPNYLLQTPEGSGQSWSVISGFGTKSAYRRLTGSRAARE